MCGFNREKTQIEADFFGKVQNMDPWSMDLLTALHKNKIKRTMKEVNLKKNQFTVTFQRNINKKCKTISDTDLNLVQPAWLGCEVTGFCCIPGTAIIYSVHEQVF